MSDYIEVHWTCPTIEEARNICRSLVETKLVACAQIVPQIESFYMWKGKVENGSESKIFLKTQRHKFEAVRAFIQENGSYEEPEVIYTEIVGGSESYLDWVRQNTD